MESCCSSKASPVMPLSKFLAHSGVCSRRQAAELVAGGYVQVNNKVAKNPGIPVSETDAVTYKGRVVHPESHVYLMLNKPRHILTTMSDPDGRATVAALLPAKLRQRVYPVGRLDKETTGLLLFTNDGECAQKLAHPRYGVQKTYHAILDRPFEYQDLERVKRGVFLPDGKAKVDGVGYAAQNDKRVVRVVLHNGKKHIVRRIFEAVGYKVKKLDRPSYAGLEKKGLRLGEWRYLTAREIAAIKKK